MRKIVYFLLYFGLFEISIGFQINSDPAPGRSPGPPGINTIKIDHGDDGETPTLLLTRDDNYSDMNTPNVNSPKENEFLPKKENELNNEKFFQNVLIQTSSDASDYPKETITGEGSFLDTQTNKYSFTKDDSSNPCANELEDYIKPSDKIIALDESIFHNDDTFSSSEYFNRLNINLDVSHDLFDTQKGITCGLMYMVRLWTNSSLDVENFFIESLTDGKVRGSFAAEILNTKIPARWFGTPFAESTKWTIENYHESLARNGQSDEHMLKPMNKWTEQERSNNFQKFNHQDNKVICTTNKWRGEKKGMNKAITLWMLNESCVKDDSVEFRLFFRTSNNSNVVYKKSYSIEIQRDCVLFLKHSIGSLDYSSLPLYSSNCTVHFPSHEEVSSSHPPGILVELTRLNVPCESGGFVKFSDRSKLCGKLEELSESERTYHFNMNQKSSVNIHKNAMFHLIYKLVDYCYNMTLNNSSGSFYVHLFWESLECFFHIHLPYGYQIELVLITNNSSDLQQSDKMLKETSYGNLRMLSSLEFNFSTNGNIRKTSDKTAGLFRNDSCDGLLLNVNDSSFYSWFRCVQTTDESKKFVILSQSNTLHMHLLRLPSNSANNLDEDPASFSSGTKSLPSVYFSYNARPIPEIVSDCAFGWVAIQQFCVLFINEAMSWQKGEQYCANLGGHLASIRSEMDQKIINEMLLNSPGYRDHNAYWVGGSDKSFEGDFRWTDGLSFQYTNWFPGWSHHGHYNKQPNDDGLSSQDCIELRRYFRIPPGVQQTTPPLSNTFMWNDRDCDAKNYFVCERSMGGGNLAENWMNECNITVSLTKEHPKASLWSPSFPRQYPDNANCYTSITAPTGYRIMLEFEELVIENEPGCSYDYLEITEPLLHRTGSAHARVPGQPSGGKDAFLKRGAYDDLGVNNEFETLHSSYESLLNIFSNLYKPTSNILIQTPDYPRGNPSYQPGSRKTTPRRMCGDWSSKLKLLRYVSNGSFLELHFVSDYSHHFGGYKAKVYVENTMPECADKRLKSYNGSCYLFVSYPEVEWWTAQQVCRGIGAQLSSVESADEHRFITTNIRNQIDYSPQVIYWLGGELKNNDQFKWTDGATMNFKGWLPGQGQFDKVPTDPICLGLQWKMSPTPMLPSGLYWEAQKCRRMGGYVCKKHQQVYDQFELKNETIRGLEGRLTSHGYPNQYPLSIDYWVHIVVPERHRVIVQFQKIDLEPQDECLYDYVSVQNYETASVLALEPGSNPVSMANEKYYEDFQHQTLKVKRTRRTRSTIDWLEVNHRLAPRHSRATLKYIRGRENNSVGDDMKIDRLRKEKHRKLSRTFEMSSHKLKRRSVEALHVKNAQSFLPYVRWCGSHDANMSKFDFVSSSNQVILNFHSDYSVSGLGFAAVWKAIDISGCPVQKLTSREGTVSSPNYPHFLINDLDCTFEIQAPIGGKVWLEFTDFEVLEDSFLLIDVGDGLFQPFQIRWHLNEGIFVSLREQIRIQIRTAQKPRGRGFQATYKTVGPFVKERVLHLARNITGRLLPLNYPHSTPADIEFTQHFVAPFGDIILLELYEVEFSQSGCPDNNTLEVYDNYADSNGTRWQFCKFHNPNNTLDTKSSKYYAKYIETQHAPVYITSYLNTIHIRQKTTAESHIHLNATLRVQPGDDLVESCQPNPCQFQGKCITSNKRRQCQCPGHFTGRFCGLTLCELEPCLFGKCELTASNFKCHCQPGYVGATCEQKQKPCTDNPCEGRGECFEKNGGFFCRCHAWWEGQRCERRMMHIPYKPLSERMLQEPFWLGLITVFVVLAVIGLVWCAKRHFPEKIEKLLAEEADRNRPPGAIHGHHHHTSLREQLQFTTSISQATATTPGAPRSIFNRLGIRKPSILSLSSPNPPGGATARTFSLDDLLRPPPRRSPSPRKKRNNSTPTKKNAAEKKLILQQLVSPASIQANPKLSLGELIQMSEKRIKVNNIDSENDQKETVFLDIATSGPASTARIMADPKLEKKVTFARLLHKVSAEMSSGSEIDVGNGMQNLSALSLPTDIHFRPSSLPQSPCNNDMRSPQSTSSNHGSDSLSSSELALSDLGLKNSSSRRIRPKVSSADSILAMFRNFASSTASVTSILPSSVFVSPSTTPSASSPQDDVLGDDESSTSSTHVPISFGNELPDSPVFYRQTTIEVPVLDALSAHKSSANNNLLHPPTILLEIPSNGINKCLSPIRELPTPIPSPALTPIMTRPRRTRSSTSQDDPLSGNCSDEDEKTENQMAGTLLSQLNKEYSRIASQSQLTPTHTKRTSTADANLVSNQKVTTIPASSITIDVEALNPEEKLQRPSNLVIPTLMVEQPSPTKDRFSVIIYPGSPPPQRASKGDSSCMFPNKQQQKKFLKQFEKPTSLDLPFTPPTITITSNASEVESDLEPLSPAPLKIPGTATLMVPNNPVSMCYLSPFAICTRADRTISESNLSSSGYSSMASPGPSRCGSSNPLCPNEMDESGSGGSSGINLSLHANLLSRRQSQVLASCKENVSNGRSNRETSDNREHTSGRSDSEVFSDDALLESNDEGIGTDHLDERLEDNDAAATNHLEVYMEEEVTENGKSGPEPEEAITMSQLQLPSIVIQADGTERALSPVSSRSESPLSERAGMGRFSPQFYGGKDQQLPFTDSDGLYDFPSSDGKGASVTHHRRSSKKRDRKVLKLCSSQSPTKNHQLDVLTKDMNNLGMYNCLKHHHHLHPHHSHHSLAVTTRKSPKRRPVQKHPIASSSSSSESLTSVRDITLRAIKRVNPLSKDKDRVKCAESSDDATGEDASSEILPNAPRGDLAKPRKMSRLRAIGNQIRFLRRLEQSIKNRDKLLSPSDSCFDEINDEADTSRITSPLLHPELKAKTRVSLSRQKKLQSTIYSSLGEGVENRWKRRRNMEQDEFNSD